MKVRPKRVLVIGGATKLLKLARRLAIESIYVQKPEADDPNFGACADHVFLADYDSDTELPALAERIFQELPFGFATTWVEQSLLAVARINDLYDLGGTSFITAFLLKNKWAMRRRLVHPAGGSTGAAVHRRRLRLVR